MLEEILIRKNPWWETRKVPEELKKIRTRVEFEQLVKYFDEKRITAIVSLRRTGKTTLMYQLIDRLIDRGINPKKILYINFDELDLLGLDRPIKQVLDLYFQRIIKQDLAELKEKVYLFFDEIHFAKNWELETKNIFDLHKQIKIFVSGSSSILIEKRAKESLVGRIHSFRLPLLSFYDFLKFNNIPVDDLDEIKVKVVKIFSAYDFRKIYEILEKNVIATNKIKRKVLYFLDDYILKGGFPEAVEKKDLIEWQNFLKEDVIERVLFYDIPTLFKIKDKKSLIGLLKFIAAESTNLMSFNSLSQNFGLRKETIGNYLTYLESAFLIKISDKYAKSFESRIKSMKKIYILDCGVRNAIIGKDMSVLNDPIEMGKNVETIVFNYIHSIVKDVFYWRDRQKNEVDIVIQKEKNLVPIEIKYSNKIGEKEIKGLIKFMKLYRAKFGVVVTKDLFDFKNKILFIPLWLFLLIL